MIWNPNLGSQAWSYMILCVLLHFIHLYSISKIWPMTLFRLHEKVTHKNVRSKYSHVVLFSCPMKTKVTMYNMYIISSYSIWLVVLWKIWVRQLGWLFPIYYGKNKKCSKPRTRYQCDPRNPFLHMGDRRIFVSRDLAEFTILGLPWLWP